MSVQCQFNQFTLKELFFSIFVVFHLPDKTIVKKKPTTLLIVGAPVLKCCLSIRKEYISLRSVNMTSNLTGMLPSIENLNVITTPMPPLFPRSGVFNRGSVAPWWSATALQGVRDMSLC